MMNNINIATINIEDRLRCRLCATMNTFILGTYYENGNNNDNFNNIEDLTQVVISYEIYETSLRRVSSISYKMNTSVGFCLSYI